MHPQISFVFVFAIFVCKSYGDLYLDNFQEYDNNKDMTVWKEHSDALMKPEGKSKSSFTLLKTQRFQTAVMFTMLNPQSCGAGIAGIMKNVTLDARGYSTIALKIRGQGQYRGYEFILRHKGQTGFDVPSYVQFFKASSEFKIVQLPLKHFKAYWHGKRLEQQEPLDKSQITSIGILGYGGRHLTKKQQGVAALEIDWIKLV